MILAKLKEATSEQHKNLEGIVNVMDEAFSIDDYKNLLLKFYRFYRAIEPKLAAHDWTSVQYNFDERLKLPKLERDLKNLNAFDFPSEGPIWDELPELDTLGMAFGSLYVIEGATLGGQIIKRHLNANLGLTPENSGEFFAGYGEDTGPKWKHFCRVITEFAKKYQNDEEIINSAKETFDSFQRCFEVESGASSDLGKAASEN